MSRPLPLFVLAAGLPLQRLREAYTEMVLIVRQLYQKCRLVHADLSEYNILYHKGDLYIIDVSQVGTVSVFCPSDWSWQTSCLVIGHEHNFMCALSH